MIKKPMWIGWKNWQKSPRQGVVKRDWVSRLPWSFQLHSLPIPKILIVFQWQLCRTPNWLTP